MEYRELAWFYNRCWAPRAVPWELGTLDALVLHLLQNARILDPEAVVTILQESQFGDITVHNAAEVLGDVPTAQRLVFRATA